MQLVNTEQYDAIYNWWASRGAFIGNPAADARKFLEEAVEYCIKAGMGGHDIERTVESEIRKGIERNDFGRADPAGLLEEAADVAISFTACVQKHTPKISAAIWAKLDVLNERQWAVTSGGNLVRPERLDQWTGYSRVYVPMPNPDPDGGSD